MMQSEFEIKEKPMSAQEIKQAIENAIDFLKQNPDEAG